MNLVTLASYIGGKGGGGSIGAQPLSGRDVTKTPFNTQTHIINHEALKLNDFNGFILKYSALTISPSLGSREPNMAGRSSNNMEVVLLYCFQNMRTEELTSFFPEKLKKHDDGSKALRTYSKDIGICGWGNQCPTEKHPEDGPLSPQTPLTKGNHPWFLTVALNCE